MVDVCGRSVARQCQGNRTVERTGGGWIEIANGRTVGTIFRACSPRACQSAGGAIRFYEPDEVIVSIGDVEIVRGVNGKAGRRVKHGLG